MSGAGRPKAPVGLGEAGKALWSRMWDALPDDLRFSAREQEVLRRACAQADREAELQKVIEEKGYMIEGSTGQDVLNPAVGELRHVEAALTGLLSRISLEDTEGKPMTPSQERAKKAATARWDARKLKAV